MVNDSYLIEVLPEPQSGVPQFKAEFGRTTVLVGSNGTGKSSILRAIRKMNDRFGAISRPVVYLQGGRTMTLPDLIRYTGNVFTASDTFESSSRTFATRRMNDLPNRTSDAFFVLDRLEMERKIKHSDAVALWQESGEIGMCPKREIDPFDTLFRLFSSLFPEISISAVQENDYKIIACRKNGQIYRASNLSDGERQALFILADIALTANERSLVIVDEPELNLNARIAERLWDLVEAELPEAIFVYATHSINFAMRPSVDRIIALGGQTQQALNLGNISDLDSESMRELLGAIPAILVAQAALVVEGTDASFDGEFYKWLMGDNKVAIVPLGSCHQVMTATRTRLWKQLASQVSIIGVIDRDYRQEAILRGFEQYCIVMDYHEAESYLCHLAVVCAIANHIGTKDVLPTYQQIVAVIVDYFRKTYLRIVAKRVSERARITLTVSPEKSMLEGALTEGHLRTIIAQVARREESKATGFVGESAALQIFAEELADCKTALDSEDIEKILILAPGKELLDLLVPQVRAKDRAALARSAFRHQQADQFVPAQSLKKKIVNSLAN